MRLLELLTPFDISQNALARQIGVPPRRINEIVLGKRSMTAETAVLLEQALGIGADMWMRLQSAYDLFKARQRLLQRAPRASRASSPAGELPALRIDPPPDPLDELLERYPIVKMGMKDAKATRGELWRTRRRKARVKAERERVRWIHEAARDAARYAEGNATRAPAATPRKRG